MKFRLNLQILADNLEDAKTDISIWCREDPLRLEGMRLYETECPLSSQYIYMLRSEQITDAFLQFGQLSFLVLGKTDFSLFPDSCAVLQIQGCFSFAGIMNTVQQTFEKYQDWDRQLQLALGSVNPLDQMLEASLAIFQNPIFAHDTNFYILSCPRHIPGMSVWVQDHRTGRLIAPLSLIHEFKFEPEYQRTLNTRGPDIYSEEMRGYRILYMNLWADGSYEGRLCVDELQSPILPGHFYALQYLGSFIELCIRQHNLFQIDMGNDARQFFIDFLDNSITEPQQVTDFLHFLNWKRHDRFLCLRMETQQQNERMHSAVATLGHIEALIPEGRAFIYQQGIVVIVNLSFKHAAMPDVISSLAILLREGYFKMGCSTQLQDFFTLPQGYLQAATALKLGKESNSMIWCYRFDDYLLEYILSESTRRMAPKLLASSRLGALQKYDADNGTDLCHTLQVYLTNERNALQTAKSLYIHRSTLFYRLERIQKISQIDLENPRERLLIQLCFLLR